MFQESSSTKRTVEFFCFVFVLASYLNALIENLITYWITSKGGVEEDLLIEIYLHKNFTF